MSNKLPGQVRTKGTEPFNQAAIRDRGRGNAMFVRRSRANSQSAASIAAKQMNAFAIQPTIDLRPIEVLPPGGDGVEVVDDQRATSAAFSEHTLFVTDAELIRRLGVPTRTGRDALKLLDGDEASGFPAKQPLWGDRRYWPAVKLWFDRLNNLPQRGNDQ